ncbi:hypothetical protein A2U01_0080799, partial [Trifolium medium]|nr:hypothetical protein [Trifolium medium]
MGMEEKVPPREAWRWGKDFIPRPVETPSNEGRIFTEGGNRDGDGEYF